MKAFLRSVIALVAFATVVVSEPKDSTKFKLAILKCCRNQEELHLSDDNSSPTCVSTSKPWLPLVYSPTGQTLQEYLPDHWQVFEGRRPLCDNFSELVHVPYRKSNPFIIVDNGEVIPEAASSDKFPADRYCADSNALLVCMPKKSAGNHAAATMRPRVRRCCGENATFHERGNTCEHLKETADAPPLLPNASSTIEIVAGFPTCPKSENFTILGSAVDATLQPDGSLEINGVVLPSGQFCVERIKELNQISKVFACPEHAPQRPVVEATDIRFTLYPVGFIISAIFLAATLAAGWLLPASHHVLHWRCQTHHVACLMMGDILMAIIQLAGDSLHGASCKALDSTGTLGCFSYRDLRLTIRSYKLTRLTVLAAAAGDHCHLCSARVLSSIFDIQKKYPQEEFGKNRYNLRRTFISLYCGTFLLYLLIFSYYITKRRESVSVPPQVVTCSGSSNSQTHASRIPLRRRGCNGWYHDIYAKSHRV
ncbi:hypothetical protein P5V15_005089 [Pogonomyrmex californicus]